MTVDAPCAHADRVEGRCTACGDCLHEVILNGACLACGTTDFTVQEKPERQGLIDPDRLIRKK